MASLQGHFLVASPHLPDPNFYRTVVLMIKHDEEGAFGLVLNRPLGNTVSDVWDTELLQPIYCGGPVDGQLMAIHGDELYSEEEILDGVHFAVRKEHLDQIVHESGAPFRIFSGYSGWGAGQLEAELRAGGWLTTRATREDVFAEDSELWSQVTSRIGLEIITSSLKPKHVPSDPSLN